MRGKGFTLLEVLISAIILIIVVAGSLAVNISVRRLSKELDYHYTALNLAKDVLEFGEAGQFGHEWSFKYYYPAFNGACSIEAFNHAHCAAVPCSPAGIGGTQSSEGYGVKEWWCFALGAGYPQPFTYIGDIKARGLVPPKAPDSVSIYTAAFINTDFYGAYEQKVTVEWKEEPNGPTKKESLAVIPIRQVNNQLRLVTADFWWE